VDKIKCREFGGYQLIVMILKGFVCFIEQSQVWFDLEIVVQGFVHDVTHSYPQKSWISGWKWLESLICYKKLWMPPHFHRVNGVDIVPLLWIISPRWIFEQLNLFTIRIMDLTLGGTWI